MKVLLDMDEKSFNDAFRKNKLPGKLLGTEKNLTLDLIYTYDEIRNRVFDSMFSDTQIETIEKKIGENRFVEVVIDRLNKMDRDLGVTSVDIDSAIWDTFDHDFESFTHPNKGIKEEISLDGLRTALHRYGENGQKGICGPWNVHDGGYDLQFEICYNGNSIVGCYGRSMFSDKGSLERHAKISDKMFSEICDLVHSAFPECSMAEEEQAKIRQNKQEQR